MAGESASANAGTDPSTIGFIGLGVMGRSVCRNLAREGARRVIAFDRDPARVGVLTQEGAEAAASPGTLAARCELILLCLSDDTQVRAVCDGRDGLIANARPGTIIVDLGTTPVDLAENLAARGAARGLQVADAPMARGREAAREGRLSLMVGCERTLFPVIERSLAAAATDITWCGPPGSGQMAKIMNNMILFETVHALAEALAVARARGMDGARLFECLMKGSADSYALRHHGVKSLLPDDYPSAAFPVTYALKDIGYALRLGEQAGIFLDGAAATRERLERAHDAGYADNYFPVLIRTLGHSSEAN